MHNNMHVSHYWISTKLCQAHKLSGFYVFENFHVHRASDVLCKRGKALMRIWIMEEKINDIYMFHCLIITKNFDELAKCEVH